MDKKESQRAILVLQSLNLQMDLRDKSFPIIWLLIERGGRILLKVLSERNGQFINLACNFTRRRLLSQSPFVFYAKLECIYWTLGAWDTDIFNKLKFPRFSLNRSYEV